MLSTTFTILLTIFSFNYLGNKGTVRKEGGGRGRNDIQQHVKAHEFECNVYSHSGTGSEE